MKQKRIGLDMPMVCIVRKDGTEECGVPIGFRSKKIPAKLETDGFAHQCNLTPGQVIQYIVFPFVEVPCTDIAELYTFDEKGERHGGKIDAPIQTHIHAWFLNRELKE
jgi:hypothetical protein